MLRMDTGFSLIELLITMALFAILSALAMPSFLAWIQNQQIRSTAEGIYNSLQRAESEAAKRNQPVDFALISNTPSNGATPSPSSTGPNWEVAVDQAGTPSASGFIQGGLAAESGKNASINSTQSIVIFSGTATVTVPGTTVPTGVVINVSDPTGGTCVSAGGPMQCLQINVTPYGSIRMCNPALPAGTPQGC